MGAILLRLPDHLSQPAAKALEHGYFVGLPDYMPWITQCAISRGQMSVEKEIPDSGSLCVPWPLPGAVDELPSPLLKTAAPLVISTATLVERPDGYRLAVELARGKINQLRNQAADWQAGGLELSPDLDEAVKNASKAFGKAVCQDTPNEADQHAEEALLHGLAAGEDLVNDYVAQVMFARTSRTPRLNTLLGCTVPQPVADAGELKAAFNALRVPFSWRVIEAEEGSYNWDSIDEWLAWAKPLDLTLEAGPLFDMSPSRLPAWLPERLGDPQGAANMMLDFLDAALERYRDQFKHWMITSGLNDPSLLELDEEESLWLNSQLYAAAQQSHPAGEFSLGLAHPWGEAVAKGTPAYSPFVYADALLRSRVQLTAIDLEVVFGVAPRGSLCRDRLDLSRLYDLYALLGIPIKVTLGVPASGAPDANADEAYQPDRNYGEAAWTPESQAGWLELAAQLTVCKPFISALTYAHYTDAQPHLFPNLGLLDAAGQPRPALAKLRDLREKYLN